MIRWHILSVPLNLINTNISTLLFQFLFRLTQPSFRLKELNLLLESLNKTRFNLIDHDLRKWITKRWVISLIYRWNILWCRCERLLRIFDRIIVRLLALICQAWVSGCLTRAWAIARHIWRRNGWVRREINSARTLTNFVWFYSCLGFEFFEVLAGGRTDLFTFISYSALAVRRNIILFLKLLSSFLNDFAFLFCFREQGRRRSWVFWLLLNFKWLFDRVSDFLLY